MFRGLFDVLHCGLARRPKGRIHYYRVEFVDDVEVLEPLVVDLGVGSVQRETPGELVTRLDRMSIGRVRKESRDRAMAGARLEELSHPAVMSAHSTILKPIGSGVAK
jgi:hypothetical protein